MDERQASGLSAAVYCGRRGLSVKTYYWWAQRFRAQRCAVAAGDGPRPLFLPVPVVRPSGVGPIPGTGTAKGHSKPEALEVVLMGGRRILVRGDFEPSVLAKVVGVLEVVPC